MQMLCSWTWFKTILTILWFIHIAFLLWTLRTCPHIWKTDLWRNGIFLWALSNAGFLCRRKVWWQEKRHSDCIWLRWGQFTDQQCDRFNWGFPVATWCHTVFLEHGVTGCGECSLLSLLIYISVFMLKTWFGASDCYQHVEESGFGAEKLQNRRVLTWMFA